MNKSAKINNPLQTNNLPLSQIFKTSLIKLPNKNDDFVKSFFDDQRCRPFAMCEQALEFNQRFTISSVSIDNGRACQGMKLKTNTVRIKPQAVFCLLPCGG